MSFQIILTYTKEDPLVDWYVLPQNVRDLIEDTNLMQNRRVD